MASVGGDEKVAELRHSVVVFGASGGSHVVVHPVVTTDCERVYRVVDEFIGSLLSDHLCDLHFCFLKVVELLRHRHSANLICTIASVRNDLKIQLTSY